MSVRDAVVKANEAARASAPNESLPALVRQAVERQEDVLKAILPATMSPERFEQLTLAAIKATPKLVRCFETPEGRVSVLWGVIQAASVGLEINTIGQEAHLIPREISFKDKDGEWDTRIEATLQLGYRGVRKLATRDPRVKSIFAEVVRDGDHFISRRGLEEDVFEHEVIGPTDRPLTHAYCVIRYHDAPAFVRVLDRAEVEKRRDVSTGYQFDLKKPPQKRTNPWFTWEAEQWRKTAIHAITRELDLNPEVEQTLAADERQIRVDHQTGELLPPEPEEETPTLPSGDDVDAGPDTSASADTSAAPEPGPGPAEPPADEPPPEDPAKVAYDEIRARIIGNKRGKALGAAVTAALEAVRKRFPDRPWGTLQEVVEDETAAAYLDEWITARDAA